MDPLIAGSMVFVLVLTVLIGGFIVTFPVLRRLGALMEESIRERRASRLDSGQLGELRGEITDNRNAIETIQRQIGLLGERQEFMENLLSHQGRGQLPGAVEAEE